MENIYKESKKFQKQFKKMKKELIRDSKHYQVFDYSFFDRIVFDAIKIIYYWYSNPKLLLQDTYNKYNKYEESLEAITKCYDIIQQLEECRHDINDYALRKELYYLIGEYGTYWWD